jgi:sigma-B regulation protein RsbU (phosphoserine phosphatase)
VGTKAIARLTLLGAIISWVVMVFADVTILVSDIHGLPPDIPSILPKVMIDIFIISLFYHYKFKIERDENISSTDLLWKVFATGLIATVVSLGLKLLVFTMGETKITSTVIFQYLVYQINLSLFISFLLAALTVWKRLILYHKSKWVLRAWQVFELLMFFLLIYDSVGLDSANWIFTPVDIALGLIALYLSANMKWVAYLNFRQKWTSLLLLLLTVFYLLYFTFTVTTSSEQIAEQSDLFLSFQVHFFNIALLAFVGLYCIFSFLVIAFNLPTSSVFEQKLEEVVNFQRLSQSIQTEQSEEAVYNILLESSVSSASADAAWLEIKTSPLETRLFTKNITEKEAQAIRTYFNDKNISGVLSSNQDKVRNIAKHLAAIKGIRFRSLISYPIYVKGEAIGNISLLKELPEGFNKEMTRIISAFSNQAGISIENFRLMEEALQNERYKEELKIAKMVSKSLLPQRLEGDKDFEITAFSESADDVGGDYYDTLRISETEVALIIADVSGKGTTAAFHMSQMKGIFHSLAQGERNPHEFMSKANRALVFCLERGSFISAAYFVVNTETKVIHYSRAGHCPVLYYRAAENKTEFLKDKGAALGMLKNSSYAKLIESRCIDYKPNDVIVLYTDGITEARNDKNEEFEQERLAEALMEVAHKNSVEIQQHIIQKLYEFTGTKNINDDYTTMIIKFM